MASPASGESLRKGNKDISNAEIADDAGIPLTKLEVGVCSETEAGMIADGKITTHAGDDDAHHTPGVQDASVGDLLEVFSGNSRNTDSTIYVKRKEILCGRNGTLRIKFDLISGTNGDHVYGKIYRNGTSVGTEQLNTSGDFTTHSEDIAGWSSGDHIQIYLHIDEGEFDGGASNFRVYDNAPVNSQLIT